METSTKRKVRTVFIAFLIASVPIGYFVYSTVLLDKAYDAFEKAIRSEDEDKIDIALIEIDKAESIVFYHSNLGNLKAQLLYQKKEYRKALKAIERADAPIFKALLYEHLNESDSALVFYEKAIPGLKRQFKESREDIFLSQEYSRQIALLYTFLEQNESAKEYLTEIPEEFDPQLRNAMLRYDYYTENYISGGYKDFLEGETVLFGDDSISNMNMDSLFAAHRFIHESCTRIGSSREYEIRKIYKQKAMDAGMNKID